MSSFWDDLFTSSREREGREKGGQYLNDIQGMKSIYGGINSIGDVNSRFGITPVTEASVQRTFNPARTNLATRNAQARSSAAARMGGSNASPELTFGNVDAAFAPQYSNLENNAAQTGLQAQTQSQQFGANFLNNIFGSREDFNKWQTSARGKALQDYLSNLSSSSGLDDILSVAGTASKFINPFSSTLDDILSFINPFSSTPMSGGGVGGIDPSQFSGKDYSRFSQIPSMSGYNGGSNIDQ